MRLTATAAALLAGLALLAGCQHATPNAAASANTTVAESPAPAASPTPAPDTASAAPSPAGCKMSGKATGGTRFAAPFMKAWLACDTGGLKGVTSAPAYDQVVKIGVPKLDMTWTHVQCDGAAGASYCTYRNKLGSDLILRIQNDATSHAITEVKLDTTVYH